MKEDSPTVVLPYAPNAQPTTRSRLRTVGRIIGWAFLGSLIALILTWGVFFVYDSLSPSHDSNESRAWSQFALVMMSPWAGFIPGLIYGIVRARKASQPLPP